MACRFLRPLTTSRSQIQRVQDKSQARDSETKKARVHCPVYECVILKVSLVGRPFLSNLDNANVSVRTRFGPLSRLLLVSNPMLGQSRASCFEFLLRANCSRFERYSIYNPRFLPHSQAFLVFQFYVSSALADTLLCLHSAAPEENTSDLRNSL